MESQKYDAGEVAQFLPLDLGQDHSETGVVREGVAPYGMRQLGISPPAGHLLFGGRPISQPTGVSNGFDEDLVGLMALVMAKKVGPIAGKALLCQFGSAGKIFRAKRKEILQVKGIGPSIADSLLERGLLASAARALEAHLKEGIEVIPWGSKAYPTSLMEVYDSPLVLFSKGKGDLNCRKGIAIVGTRTPTDLGKELAREFARAFVAAGIQVVSGLAYGIDAEAHEAVVDLGGQTTAVLGHGLDIIYPSKHRRLAGRVAETGNLISEFPMGVGPDACNFPARNRVISGICGGIVVVEAAETGGALITARAGFDQDREIFAIPGNIRSRSSAGCNRLIRDNIAKLVTSPEEVLFDMGWDTGGGDPFAVARKKEQWERKLENLPLEERKVMEQFGQMDQGSTVEQLANGLGMAHSSLQMLLLGLEFKGFIKYGPGGKVLHA